MRRDTVFVRPWPKLSLLLVAFTLASQTALGNVLNGRVTMSGSITTSACSMRVDSEDQTIDMGQLSLAQFVNGEASIQKPFRIHFFDCGISGAAGSGPNAAHPFTLIFEGDEESHLFQAKGSAQGVAMRLQDSNGNTILPGKSQREYLPPSGDMTLSYLLSLQGTGQALKAGNYQITVRLRMHYF
ncbi:fimbrial protein [Achromobacter pestifer]